MTTLMPIYRFHFPTGILTEMYVELVVFATSRTGQCQFSNATTRDPVGKVYLPVSKTFADRSEVVFALVDSLPTMLDEDEFNVPEI
jgi:hypothetical protein